MSDAVKITAIACAATVLLIIGLVKLTTDHSKYLLAGGMVKCIPVGSDFVQWSYAESCIKSN